MDQTIPQEIDSLSERYLKILPTGSRVIAPGYHGEDADEDYLVLIDKSQEIDLALSLDQGGWRLGGSRTAGQTLGYLNVMHDVLESGRYDMSNVFNSWKLSRAGTHSLNLLVTANPQYFNDFVRATFLAKRLFLTNKKSRVILFKAICGEDWPDGKDEVEDKPKEQYGRPAWMQYGTLRVNMPVESIIDTVNLVEAPVPTTLP